MKVRIFLLVAPMVWPPLSGVAKEVTPGPWRIDESECPPGTTIVRHEMYGYVGDWIEHGCRLPGEGKPVFEGPVYQSDRGSHVRSLYRARVREGRYRVWHMNGRQWVESEFTGDVMSFMDQK